MSSTNSSLRSRNTLHSYMKRKFNSNLSCNGVYYAACSWLEISKDSCSKLHCQKGFNLIPFSCQLAQHPPLLLRHSRLTNQWSLIFTGFGLKMVHELCRVRVRGGQAWSFRSRLVFEARILCSSLNSRLESNIGEERDLVILRALDRFEQRWIQLLFRVWGLAIDIYRQIDRYIDR
jgi:hypothetical protein